ncbi:MAG: diguanylate cyclase, partial [Bacteroidia bacterium]|nr:diguanylate cyclase [Bacteroidia bacterium]
MTNISVNYMGLTLNSPVIAASSGLTTQLDKIESFERAGVGAIVVKSLFEEQIVDEAAFLNSRSSDYPESADYLHHYMRQYSIEKYLNLLREIKAKVSIPVIASINCYSKGEWVSYAREIEKTGVNAIELNIYSLPLNIHKSSTDVEKDYLDVIGTVTKMLKIPVAVKIAGYVTNLPGFVNNLKAYGAKGVVMFNRFYTPDIDITKLKIVAAEAFSTETESLRELRW